MEPAYQMTYTVNSLSAEHGINAAKNDSYLRGNTTGGHEDQWSASFQMKPGFIRQEAFHNTTGIITRIHLQVYFQIENNINLTTINNLMKC